VLSRRAVLVKPWLGGGAVLVAAGSTQSARTRTLIDDGGAVPFFDLELADIT
jgi:hypothetical protein